MNFYLKCADILKQIRTKKGNFKTILYGLLNKNKISSGDSQKAYPIVIRTVKNLGLIDCLIVHLKDFSPKMRIKNMDLLRILMGELFLGKYKEIKGGGQLKKSIMDQHDLLKIEFENIKKKFGYKEDEEADNSIIIKRNVYIRIVNSQLTLQDIQDTVLPERNLEFDALIPNLIELSYEEYRKLRISENFILSNKYIIQSKSSCLPPFLLCRWLLKKGEQSKKRIDIIDACSAPGNKTTQLAEYQPKGTIFAIERDHKRFDLLKSRIGQYGFQNVECIEDSFLNLDEQNEKFKSVRFIMVDPTCSGSGMANNLEKLAAIKYEKQEFELFCNQQYQSADKSLKEKLQNLQENQLILLDKAAKFPSVLRISYSTCSIFEMENEEVVQKFLQTHPEFELLDLSKYNLTPGFRTKFSDGFKCLRADPLNDKMDGFFVALFKRRKNE